MRAPWDEARTLKTHCLTMLENQDARPEEERLAG